MLQAKREYAIMAAKAYQREAEISGEQISNSGGARLAAKSRAGAFKACRIINENINNNIRKKVNINSAHLYIKWRENEIR